MKRITDQILLLFVILVLGVSCKPKPIQILIPKDATAKESLAASEIRKYVYLRTGILPEIEVKSRSELPSSGQVLLI